MYITRRLLALVCLTLLCVGLLAACGEQQQAQNRAGTSTQDPPIPRLTEATHGILDTTGTVPQSLIAQLQARSDQAQAHGYQIAVVFFNDLAGDPHQFATEVFNQNGVGFKDTDNGVLFVLYLEKQGKDGHAPWLSYITGGGISGALPDTLMDDYAQNSFVPARAQGQWQQGLLAFYDRVYQAELDPNIAREWQTQHPKPATGTDTAGTGNSSSDAGGWLALLGIVFVGWLMTSAIVAIWRRQNFFVTAFRLLGHLLTILAIFGSGSGGGSSGGGSSSGGGGSWGGGGSSSSSGGDV